MTTHSLLLNSITFRAHIQRLVLHRQEEAEQAHSFHQPVWLSAVPGGTGGLHSSSVLACLQNGSGRACFEIRPGFGNCISEKVWSPLLRRDKQLSALRRYSLALTDGLSRIYQLSFHVYWLIFHHSMQPERSRIFSEEDWAPWLLEEWKTQELHLVEPALVKAEYVNRSRKLIVTDHKTFS